MAVMALVSAYFFKEEDLETEEHSLSVQVSIPAHSSSLHFPLILISPVIQILCVTKDAWSPSPNQDLYPSKPAANGPREFQLSNYSIISTQFRKEVNPTTIGAVVD